MPCRRRAGALSLVLVLGLAVPALAAPPLVAPPARMDPASYQSLPPEAQALVQLRTEASASVVASVSETPLVTFGHELFAGAPPVPASDLPVPADYRIGPGDELVISVASPRRTEDLTLTVGRDGTVSYPGVGPLAVQGLSFRELSRYLDRTLRGGAPHMRLAVRLGRIRSIQVLVVGHVKRPGTYTLSALSCLSHGLMAAGGPTQGGSLRRLQLRRGGHLAGELDLYDLLLRGENGRDLALESGDVLFVPEAGPMVEVTGPVRRPARYELRGPTPLGAVLALAGNVAPEGDVRQVQIERTDDHQDRKVLDLDLSRPGAAAGTRVLDGDRVRVFAARARLTNAVTLAGHVARPGRYAYRSGMRVHDVLRSERDLKPEAFLEFGLIERVTPPDAHLELIPFHVERALAGETSENKLLAPEDTVRIYYRWEGQAPPTVRLAGAVQQPGEFRLHPRMTVADLVRLAGGLAEQADHGRAELTRTRVVANELKTERFTLDLDRALGGMSGDNLTLARGDYLLVKPVPNFQRFRTLTLLGEVAQPGSYSFRDGESLGDVLARAGGLAPRAYLRGAVFTRQSVRRQQEERLQDLIDKLQVDLYRQTAAAAGTALSADAVAANAEIATSRARLIETLKGTRTAGRMILAGEQVQRAGHQGVMLEDGDTLVVPPVLNSVSVLGQVYNPTALVYEPGCTAGEYLARTGGPTASADRDGIYVVRADGSVVTDQTAGGNPWSRGVRAVVLEPGDAVMVPEQMRTDTSIRDLRDITQILFQIATTAAVTWGMLR